MSIRRDKLTKNNVITLAEKSHDNRLWTPEQMLEGAIKDLQSGEIKATRAFVILLEEHDEREGFEYDVDYTWYRSNIDKRLMIYSMEKIKVLMLTDKDDG